MGIGLLTNYPLRKESDLRTATVCHIFAKNETLFPTHDIPAEICLLMEYLRKKKTGYLKFSESRVYCLNCFTNFY